MTKPPSTEERIWAVLSHLSAIAFGMGLLLPVIGWSEQRRKSNYASFQCLQALGYQSLGYTVWILLALVVVMVQSLDTLDELITAFESGADPGMLITTIMGGHFLVMAGLIGLYLLLPVVAAVACALGKDFRYPYMGNRLARYLGYNPNQPVEEPAWLNEDHEDRWVVGMGHFCVIIVLWGMLAPLTVWILQGKRSPFLKFQAIQTLVYQAIAIALSIGALAFYFFGAIVLLSIIGVAGSSDLDSSVVMVGFAVFAISSLITILTLLFIPLMHILGQWAGYRVLKGDDYRYPIVSKLVAKWIPDDTSSSILEMSPKMHQ
jgi:uncharacterized Tic20 family protein